MRLASFNVENLFSRARALNQENWAEGRAVLDAFARFSALIAQPRYPAADKAAMVALLEPLGLLKSDDGAFVRLQQNRGSFLVRRRGGAEIVAEGRGDWTGGLELAREPVDDLAMRLTARVIREVDADVIGIVEAESRPALKAFSDTILPLEQGAPYPHVMLIDGNDPRGIDCALMTRAAHPILRMQSHVDLADEQGPVFSRDCPVFHLGAPGGGLVVLVNHLKSKGFGRPAQTNARRRRQAEAVAGIYRSLRAEGLERIVVVGDLNDTPPREEADPLHPLLAGTDLRDIATLPGHDDKGRPGTFGASAAGNKIDYILLSPALQACLRASGVFRMGQWPGTRPKKWEVFPEIDPDQGGAPQHAASDHAALWAELEL
jgi:endonuclease/exonuclease/phosphatase family metal-dependent hydrolase